MSVSVAELCQSHRIDIEELTRRCGLDEARVLAIVMGRWTPSPHERKQIANVFEVPTGEITWGHVTPIQHIYGQGPA